MVCHRLKRRASSLFSSKTLFVDLQKLPSNALVIYTAATSLTTMPNVSLPTGQDWDSVNVGKSGAGGRTKTPKSAREITMAKAAGTLATEKR